MHCSPKVQVISPALTSCFAGTPTLRSHPAITLRYTHSVDTWTLAWYDAIFYTEHERSEPYITTAHPPKRPPSACGRLRDLWDKTGVFMPEGSGRRISAGIPRYVMHRALDELLHHLHLQVAGDQTVSAAGTTRVKYRGPGKDVLAAQFTSNETMAWGKQTFGNGISPSTPRGPNIWSAPQVGEQRTVRPVSSNKHMGGGGGGGRPALPQPYVTCHTVALRPSRQRRQNKNAITYSRLLDFNSSKQGTHKYLSEKQRSAIKTSATTIGVGIVCPSSPPPPPRTPPPSSPSST